MDVQDSEFRSDGTEANNLHLSSLYRVPPPNVGHKLLSIFAKY